MWLVKIAAVLCGVYFIIVAAMYFAQTRLIFPAFMVSDERPPLPLGTQPLAIDTPDGLRLHGVHLPSPRSDDGDRTLMLGFGGNGWHAEGMALDLRRFFPDRDIVVFNYRGYRPSTGSPSATGILADSLLVYDRAQAIGPSRVVVVGYSLGSGVAAYVARERSVAGLILVTPFDSLEAVAAQHYPWLPVRWLLRHRMPSVDFLRGLTPPIAVIAAEKDEIVPPARTAALREAVGNLVLDRTIGGARHNDIYQSVEFAKAMAEARAAIDANSAPRSSRDSGQSAR